MTADTLQALACALMEDKDAMDKITSIKLTLSKSLTKAQEEILVLSKQLHALQSQAKANTPTTERLVLDNKSRDTKSKRYCWNNERTRSLDHTRAA